MRILLSLSCGMILLGFCAPVVHARQSSEWTTEDLAGRGSVRLVDLLETLEPLRSWSTDRYTPRFVGMGLGGAHSLGPAVVVDGLWVTNQFMDRTQVELVPVVTEDISSIRYVPGWTMLSDGRMVDGHLIVSTVRPRGFSVRGSLALTNETGDPGPAFYASPGVKNVDRAGPAAGVRVSWGNPSWYFQASMDTDSFHMTDSRIEGRVWRVFKGGVKPIVSHATPSFRMAYQSDRTKMDWWGGQTVKRNFLFDEVAGWEWPVKEYRYWMLGKLSTQIADHWSIGLTGGFRQSKTGNLESGIDLPNNLHIRELHAEARLNASWDRFSAVWAGGGRTNEWSQDGVATPLTRKSLYGRTAITLNMEDDWEIRLESGLSSPASGSSDLSEMSYLAGATLEKKKSSGGKISLGATLQSDVVRDSWTTLALLQAGMTLDDWAPSVTAPEKSTRTESLEFVLKSSSFIRPNLLLWMDLRARKSSGLVVPERSFERDISDLIYRAPTSFKIGHQGIVASPSLGITLTSGTVKATLSYQYLRLIARGDLLFWKNFSGLSPHLFGGSVHYSPAPRFRLYARARVGGSPRWPDYATYDDGKLPRAIRIDGTVTKDMWDDHLTLSLTVLNLLDQPLIRHPAGVDEQMAVRFSVSARFSDVSSPR